MHEQDQPNKRSPVKHIKKIATLIRRPESQVASQPSEAMKPEPALQPIAPSPSRSRTAQTGVGCVPVEGVI